MLHKFQNVLDMRWLIRYLNFIKKFQTTDDIYHNHHILPRSLYKQYINDDWNIVKISYRSHLIAHYMLAKALGGSMWYAYNCMNSFNKKLNSVLYNSAMCQIKYLQSNRMKLWMLNNPHPRGMLGKKHSIETIEKISNWSKELTFNNRIIITQKVNITRLKNGSNNFSAEHQSNISKSKIGKNHSVETKERISSTRKERIGLGQIDISISSETRNKMNKSIKKHFTENDHHTKGKKYEEIMGDIKAKKLKDSKCGENNVSKRLDVRQKISNKLKGKKKSKEQILKMKSLKTINNQILQKRVQLESLDEYLKNGWVLGSLKIECEYCKNSFAKNTYSQHHGIKCKDNI